VIGRAASTGPPSAAVRLLQHSLPIHDADVVIGDLTELYADRVETRRHFTRL
jgi:hypothetical protein